MWKTNSSKHACVVLGLNDHIGWLLGKDTQLIKVSDSPSSFHKRLTRALQRLGLHENRKKKNMTLCLEEELSSYWRDNNLHRLKTLCQAHGFQLKRVFNWPIQLSHSIAQANTFSSTFIITHTLCIMLYHEKKQCYYSSLTQRVTPKKCSQLTLLAHAFTQHNKGGETQTVTVISNNPHDCSLLINAGIHAVSFPWKPQQWPFLYS